MADNNKSRLVAKEKGLCTMCHNKLDRVGIYCTGCLVKERERHKKDRIWYLQNGICPMCRKVKLFGNEKTCPECLAKNYSSVQKRDKEKTKEYEEKYKKRRKEIREQYTEKGICYNCRKRKIEPGKVRCRICLDKNSESHRKKHIPIREKGIAEGLCYQCVKNKATNGKLCKGCYDKAVSELEKWRKTSFFYKSHHNVINASFR